MTHFQLCEILACFAPPVGSKTLHLVSKIPALEKLLNAWFCFCYTASDFEKGITRQTCWHGSWKIEDTQTWTSRTKAQGIDDDSVSVDKIYSQFGNQKHRNNILPVRCGKAVILKDTSSIGSVLIFLNVSVRFEKSNRLCMAWSRLSAQNQRIIWIFMKAR